jgi:hypothetical protein
MLFEIAVGTIVFAIALFCYAASEKAAIARKDRRRRRRAIIDCAYRCGALRNTD